MVFRRRFVRRPMFRRKRFFKRKRFNPGIRALQVLRRNVEMKYADFNITTAIASDVPVITELTAISQSDTNATRTGNKITIKSIHIRGHITTGIDTTSVVRNILVIDRQQVSDSDPTFAQLLSSTDVDSNLSLNSAGRFKILMDKSKVLTPMNSDIGTAWYINKYIKFPRGIQVRYNGTGVGDIQKNGIFLFQISDVAAAATEPIQNLNVRVGFTDM